jgi:hypothetical protein
VSEKDERRARHRQAFAAARRDPFPVTVTRQPVTRCDLCHTAVSYPARPGAAAVALTAHYQQAHPDGIPVPVP